MPPKPSAPKTSSTSASNSPKTTRTSIAKHRQSDRVAAAMQSKPTPGSPKSNTIKPDNDVTANEIDIDSQFAENDDAKSNKKSCPCGKSSQGQCWVLTCLDCKQAWHQACAGLKADLGKAAIDSLLKSWQCPWCFLCPYNKPASHLSNKNTKTIQEKVMIASTVKSITDSITEENEKLCNMIKHLEDRIGAVTSDIDAIQGTQNAISVRVLKIGDIETHMQHQILNQATLDQKMKSLQTALAAIQESVANQSQITTQPLISIPHPSLVPTISELDEPACHNQLAMAEMKEDFISEDEAVSLSAFLESLPFSGENGHSVIAYGAQYKYTGSRSSDQEQAIPDELKPLFDKVNNLQKEVFCHQYPDSQKYNRPHPDINSVLINKYEGTESFLPKHSDDEETIHPESQIFTLSMGAKCNIEFTPKLSNDPEPPSVVSCSNRSLYRMTRKSQDFFSHEIKPGQTENRTRYSLTFRSVSKWNKNSTCVVGDSNTGYLTFGTDKRKSFGEMMPGQRFWAPKVESINPSVCCSYSNVVVMCGINNIKQTDVSSTHNVDAIYRQYYDKIAEIRKLNAKCKIFVCPILPTKCYQLNQGALHFNSLIFDQLTRGVLGVQYVQGFNSFLEYDGSGLLSRNLSRQVDRNNQPDMLHLNFSGVRRLAGFIKQSVLNRSYSSGIRRGKNGSPSNRVNGQTYSGVITSPSSAGDAIRHGT